MTDIEQKALALVNEVAGHDFVHPRDMGDKCWLLEALCRVIEQLEAEKAARAADRQMVSDAVEAATKTAVWGGVERILSPFIIAKPDPLVEAMRDACRAQGRATEHTPGELTKHLRAAIEKRGGKIVWGEG